jgi:hypothetical protein
MVWPFRKKTLADKVMEVSDPAINLVAERWLGFSQKLVFKSDVGLDEQIAMFSTPAFEGMRNTFPILRDSPDEVLFIWLLMGVERSGTHAKSEIEQAFNLQIPV